MSYHSPLISVELRDNVLGEALHCDQDRVHSLPVELGDAVKSIHYEVIYTGFSKMLHTFGYSLHSIKQRPGAGSPR